MELKAFDHGAVQHHSLLAFFFFLFSITQLLTSAAFFVDIMSSLIKLQHNFLALNKSLNVLYINTRLNRTDRWINVVQVDDQIKYQV